MANESNRRLDTGHAKRDFRLRQLIARMAEIPFLFMDAPRSHRGRVRTASLPGNIPVSGHTWQDPLPW